LGCGSCSAGSKHALIAHLIERLAAAPNSLPSPSRSGAHNPAHDEFRRVSFTVTCAALPDAMVYSSSSTVRDEVSGRGTWAFLPARLPGAETAACRIEW
jgi:cytochrome oxidase assembly protein ShyY1